MGAIPAAIAPFWSRNHSKAEDAYSFIPARLNFVMARSSPVSSSCPPRNCARWSLDSSSVLQQAIWTSFTGHESSH